MWAAPSFSPNGSLIVLGRARVTYASQTSTYDLYLMDRDGSDRRLLFPQDDREPGLEYPAAAWDPADGRVLVVYRGDLWLVMVDEQARRGDRRRRGHPGPLAGEVGSGGLPILGEWL